MTMIRPEPENLLYSWMKRVIMTMIRPEPENLLYSALLLLTNQHRPRFLAQEEPVDHEGALLDAVHRYKNDAIAIQNGSNIEYNYLERTVDTSKCIA